VHAALLWQIADRIRWFICPCVCVCVRLWL